ncbi:MAG: Hsp20 family protein, partial [Syntrophaceae bacterium]|nr:Hsp20 family protein [Syntrophaceae bacterium]
KGHSACCTEYGVSDYERTFRIGDVIDHEHISATIKDGVLSVTLPKIDRAQVKKIAVNAIQ